jgi:hypothetical protein
VARPAIQTMLKYFPSGTMVSAIDFVENYNFEVQNKV